MSVTAGSLAGGDGLSSTLERALPEVVDVVAGVVTGQRLFGYGFWTPIAALAAGEWRLSRKRCRFYDSSSSAPYQKIWLEGVGGTL